MKRDKSILKKSSIQTMWGVFIFAFLVFFLGLITYVLQEFLGINFNINKEDLNLVLAIMATIGTAMYIYNSDKLEKEKEDIRKQIDLLKILYQELDFLSGNLKSYKKTFSGEKTYPFYELWNIDTSVYFRGLSYKINDQETIELKKNLMIIKDKTLIINNMKFESRKLEEERSGEEIVKYAVKELRKGIRKVIDKDLLPTINKSREMIDNLVR